MDAPEPARLGSTNIDQKEPETQLLEVRHNLQGPGNTKRNVDGLDPRTLGMGPELVRAGNDSNSGDLNVALLVFYHGLCKRAKKRLGGSSEKAGDGP